MKDVYDIVREATKRHDEHFALATLVRAHGSSYRRPGARMLICTDGTLVGSLSAGCLEDEVAECAREVLKTGIPRTITFDTRKRFGCDGQIDIFVERVSNDLFVNISDRLKARQSCVVVTMTNGTTVGAAVGFPSEGAPGRNTNREANSFPYSAFVQHIHPPLHLLIVGDAPDTKPFHALCQFLGWQAIEIPGIDHFAAGPDNWTAAIVKSHNYGRDFAALQKLLPLNLRYVGLIGPRRRRDQLLHDLLELGVTINASFFSPAGLDLGAETPEEIALAVVSEIQRVFSSGSGFSLRDRKVAIHASECQTSPQ